LWKNIEIEVIKQNAIETAMIPPQNTFGDILFFGVLMLIVCCNIKYSASVGAAMLAYFV